MSFSGNYNSPDPAMDAENQSPGLGNLFGLLSVTMVLVAFGLNMLYSAGGSDMGVASRLFYNQLAMTVLGVLGGTVVFILSPRFFCKRSLWWLAGCAVLLIWARFSKEVNGAHRWIHVAGHTFQPSELAKIAVAIFVADYCAEHQRTFNTLDPRSHYGMLPLAAGVGIMLLLIVIGKDLGTTLLVAAVAFLTMCVANLKWYFYAVPLALAPVGVLFIRFFDPMRWARMTIYLDPERYKNQEGYQLWNAFMALGSGAWYGVGLGHSRLKAKYLPEAHTDFIIAIIGEELGYLGVLAVILLYIVWGFFAIRIALQARKRSYMLLGCALTLGVVLQAIINLGVVSGLFPTKGMPAPFISYGGSNMVCSLLATGFLAAIAMDNCISDYNVKWWRQFKNFLRPGRNE
ncbi:MAG: cell division protein FtsW [Lentisphaeria bacterium]|nr:cell division protein FtsW [Lentisphaeria bacterium]